MKNNNSENALFERETSKSSLNTPLIFTKKVNDKYKVIPLSEIRNTLGKPKFFPPATREWFNSIYAYNVNTLKNLPSADKTLSKIIKNYFNLFFSKRIIKSKFIPLRYKRLSLKKIFVSKAELKHTTTKVIITLYIYNQERRLLNFKINTLVDYIAPIKPKWWRRKEMYFKKSLFLINLKKLSLLKRLNNQLPVLESFNDENLNTSLYKNIALLKLKEDIRILAYYKLFLNLNKSKFEDNFLSKLKPLISRIYNKEVEFNIVNLKTLYFNSDIFTQAISMKIKNKKTKLIRVLKSSLKLAKIPVINKMREKYRKNNQEEQWLNKVKNLKINNIVKSNFVSPLYCSAKEGLDTRKVKQNNDLLSELLLNIFPNSKTILSYNTSSLRKASKAIKAREIQEEGINKNVILNSLKYKTIAGLRLEAKGRISKRSTASRSVFKVKWKGSLKNIDSSYRGLSSTILRGHLKPNIQYSVINSKVRTGSFGLKGWIGSK